MAITAAQVTTNNSLEQFRQQFNNLQSDVRGLESGEISFSTISTTTLTGTTVNVAEDGTIVFEGATDDAYETTLTVTDPTADRTITLPNETGTVLTDASTINASTFTVSANNTANETVYPIFVDGATGSQGAETDSGLSYNPSTELLTVGKLLLDDGATIGVASSTSAITVASTGIVTFVDDILIKDGGTIGSASAATAITIASSGIVTFVDDIVIKDGGTIGTSTDADSMTIAAAGAVTFSQKDVHSVGMSVKNGSTSAGFVEFFENSGNGTNKATLIGPASTADVTLTLPSTTDTIAVSGDVTALAIALG